jgi:DNA-binding CsgD family transcriptional regulator
MERDSDCWFHERRSALGADCAAADVWPSSGATACGEGASPDARIRSKSGSDVPQGDRRIRAVIATAARRVRRRRGRRDGSPLLFAHATRRRPALRLSEAVDARRLSHSELYGDLLHRSGVEYAIAIGVRPKRREAVVAGLGRTERQFSERDRDVLDLVRPALEDALRAAEARGRLVRALAANPPPGTAVVLLDRYGEIEHSSPDAQRWLAEHFGAAEHPGWLPGPVAGWLALPPRPAARQRARRPAPQRPPAAWRPTRAAARGGGHGFRPETLRRLGLSARETEVLCAAMAMNDEADIAWELFLSLHAVRERLARLEAKLGARTAAEAVARTLSESP